MKEDVRRKFHDVLCCLHKITIQAGSNVEKAKIKRVEDMNENEMKEFLLQALKTLASLEKTALETGMVVEDLKKNVYKNLKIDNSEPLK
ncbi:MAG: hypothetical protein ABH844_04160 [Candidatus Omnitrophota bacterium]